MNIFRALLCILIYFICSDVYGSKFPESAVAKIAWIAEGEFCEPETVLPLPDTTFLISNVCGFQEKGSGFLTLLDFDGQTIEWRIVDKLDAPLGMTLFEDRLTVVDNNKLKIFKWPGYVLLETIELDSMVANDVAVSSEGIIYVTDSGRHQVIEIQADRSQSIFTGKPQFKTANGIEIYGNDVYIGGDRLWRVDLQDLAVDEIGPEWLRDIDGIEFEKNGTMQITPVGGPLVRFFDEQNFEVLGGNGVSSANHGYSELLKLALIPTGFDNTVIAIDLSD